MRDPPMPSRGLSGKFGAKAVRSVTSVQNRSGVVMKSNRCLAFSTVARSTPFRTPRVCDIGRQFRALFRPIFGTCVCARVRDQSHPSRGRAEWRTGFVTEHRCAALSDSLSDPPYLQAERVPILQGAPGSKCLRSGLPHYSPVAVSVERSIYVSDWPSGGMADALDSKSSGATCVGSSPTLAT